MTESVHYSSVPDLIEAGILSIAKLPPANFPNPAEAPFYTIPLLAEDYPAKTAVMWNEVYRTMNIPDRNTMCVADPAQAGLILGAFRRDLKYRGGGAGVGFKEAVIAHLDDLTPEAKAIGAVNIIRKEPDGRLIGGNTDGAGYAASLEELFRARGDSLAGKKIMLLGAGGSGHAIAFAAAARGAKVTILNRTEKRAHELADRILRHFGPGVARGGGRHLIPILITEQHAVVSVIDDKNSPLDAYSTLGAMEFPITEESKRKNLEESAHILEYAKPDLIVSDIRIRKEETAMLTQARATGFRTLDGIPMVVNQGILAFWWLYENELAPKGYTEEDVAAIMRSAADIS